MRDGLTLTTPALLFPAISLLFLAYNGRFLALAQLIRGLHAEFRREGDPGTLAQIGNLRRRLALIRHMEMAAVAAFCLAALSMLLLYLGRDAAGGWVFGAALTLLFVSLLLSLAEIHISINALRWELGEMQHEPGPKP
jgi:hypothetical protein